MTLLPDGGPALPVAVTTTRMVQGGSAIPVYGYTTAPTDGRPSLGGVAVPVRVLTAADLKQNGGQWTVEGRPYAMPVYTAPATARVMGGPALAVYPVNAWPTATPAFTPTDIAGLNIWAEGDKAAYQDAGKTTPATADGDLLGAVVDYSGNGRDFTGTGAARPTLKTGANGLNGKPIWRFTATNLLSTAALTWFPAKRGTLFILLKNTKGDYGIPIRHEDGPPVQQLYIPGPGYANYSWFDASLRVLQASALETTWQLLTLNRTGNTTMNFRKNGAAIGDATIGDAVYGSAALSLNAASESFAGDMAAVILYDASLTAGQVGQVETYLNGRWAVY